MSAYMFPCVGGWGVCSHNRSSNIIQTQISATVSNIILVIYYTCVYMCVCMCVCACACVQLRLCSHVLCISARASICVCVCVGARMRIFCGQSVLFSRSSRVTANYLLVTCRLHKLSSKHKVNNFCSHHCLSSVTIPRNKLICVSFCIYWFLPVNKLISAC